MTALSFHDWRTVPNKMQSVGSSAGAIFHIGYAICHEHISLTQIVRHDDSAMFDELQVPAATRDDDLRHVR